MGNPDAQRWIEQKERAEWRWASRLLAKEYAISTPRTLPAGIPRYTVAFSWPPNSVVELTFREFTRHDPVVLLWEQDRRVGRIRFYRREQTGFRLLLDALRSPPEEGRMLHGWRAMATAWQLRQTMRAQKIGIPYVLCCELSAAIKRQEMKYGTWKWCQAVRVGVWAKRRSRPRLGTLQQDAVPMRVGITLGGAVTLRSPGVFSVKPMPPR